MKPALRVILAFVLIALFMLEMSWRTKSDSIGVHQMNQGPIPMDDATLVHTLFQDVREDRLDATGPLFINSHAAADAPLSQLHDLLQADGQPTLTGWFDERYLGSRHKTVLAYQFGHGDLARQALLKIIGTVRSHRIASMTIRQGGDIDAKMHRSNTLLRTAYIALGVTALGILFGVVLRDRPRS